MAKRRSLSAIPIWIRVPGLIALVLVAIVVSTVMLSRVGDVGGHAGSNPVMNPATHGSGDGATHGSSGGGWHGAGQAGG